MEGNNSIFIVLILVLAGAVLFFALKKEPEQRKPGLFESLGGFADGLSSKAGGGLLGFL
jgi:hypothetical protein